MSNVTSTVKPTTSSFDPFASLNNLIQIFNTGSIKDLEDKKRELNEKKYEEMGMYEEINKAEAKIVEVLSGQMKGHESAANFGRSILEVSPEDASKRIPDILKGILMVFRGTIPDELSEKLTNKEVLDKISGNIPDPDKIAEAFAVRESLAPMANPVRIIMSSFGKIIASLKNGDVDGAINLIMSSIDDLSKTDGFLDLLKRILGKAINNSKASDAKSDKASKDAIKSKEKEDKKPVEKKQDQKPEVAAAMSQTLVSGPAVADDAGFKPSFTQPENAIPESKGTVPAVIAEAAIPPQVGPTVPGIATPKVQKIIVNPDLVAKYVWLDKIIECAANNGYNLEFEAVKDPAGNDRMITCTAYDIFGAFSPSRSFTIDLGQIITKDIKLWPNYSIDGTGYFTQINVENCDYALKVLNDKSKTEIRRVLFDKIFALGFQGLNKDDIYGQDHNLAFGENKMITNRTIVWMTIPRIDDKEKRKVVINDIITLAKGIVKNPTLANIRFRIAECDADNRRYVLTNENTSTYYLGEPQEPAMLNTGEVDGHNCPIATLGFWELVCTVDRDDQGEVITKKEDGHTRPQFSIDMIIKPVETSK